MLISILVADIFAMLGGLNIMWARYGERQTRLPDIPRSAPIRKMPAPAAQPDPAAAASVVPVSPAAATAKAPARSVLFTYRNSKPRAVELIGSFNNWTPQPLAKGKNFMWTAAVPLAPGEYTYNYLVDGKAIRDPNNPRTATEGRSLLIVKPATK